MSYVVLAKVSVTLILEQNLKSFQLVIFFLLLAFFIILLLTCLVPFVCNDTTDCVAI